MVFNYPLRYPAEFETGLMLFTRDLLIIRPYSERDEADGLGLLAQRGTSYATVYQFPAQNVSNSHASSRWPNVT
jgi:hypothetical protein